ncbi:MAG TPA: septum formation initiator family protein [Acidimicrobiia bacterium]
MSLFRRPGVLVSTLLILLMGAAFLTQVVPYGQIIDSRRQVSEAEAQLADLEAENASLQADVEALETPGEIEKLAREKLGYVRPGETAYVVLDPPGTPDDTVEPEATAAPAEDKTWVDRLWEFLSGADLD